MNSEFKKLQLASKELARNINFLEIDRIRNKFNIFFATDMQNREIKHTKFLAYLLDPNESHGLGHEFLIRFLQRLPIENKNEFNLLDLNLEFTKVISEKSLNQNQGDEKLKAQIDLIVEIPSIEMLGKRHVLIIENKLKSKQGIQQLSRYKKIAESHYGSNHASMNYYYLTLTEEEPDDDSWMSILYTDCVVSSLVELLKYASETISEYLKNIFNDYIDLLSEGGREDHLCEERFARIDQELIADLLLFKRFSKESLPPEYVRLETKYPRAIQFINLTFENRDEDLRKPLLLYFKSLFQNKSDTDFYFDHEKKLYLENSSIQYLRFGFMSSENSQFIKQLSSDASIDWLNGSRRHLALEFTVKNSAKLNGRFNVSLYIVLGPLGSQYNDRRQGIYDCLAEFLLGEKSVKLVGANNHNKILLEEYKLKDEPTEVVKKWLETTLSKLAKDKLLVNMNKQLSNHFEKLRTKA